MLSSEGQPGAKDDNIDSSGTLKVLKQITPLRNFTDCRTMIFVQH